MDDILIINSKRDERVFIRATSGHFITASAHIDFYVGTSDIKHNHDVSVPAARLLAEYYHMRGIRIDTVLCLYETQTLGAYVAHELSKPNMFNPNPPTDIFVLGPEYDASGNMIFRDNLIRMIKDKRVLILMSCITSGRTVERAMDSVAYYGGRVAGICAAFSSADQIGGIEVNRIFSDNDLPSYQVYDKHNCPLCQQGVPVDAIANGYGYSRLKR